MSLESKSETALEHLLLAIEAQGAGGCTIGGSVITGVCTMSSVTGGCAFIWQCWLEILD